MHPSALPIDELLRDCDIQRTRRSGPGGQHRNKVETAIVIEHRPTGLRAEASERRSQKQNQDTAAFRLRVSLALNVRTEHDDHAALSALWRSRCRGGRISVNPTHEDFPTLLAEAMDVIASCDIDIPDAAARLTCSTSQLVKLLKLEPKALERVNAEREARGLGRLR